MARFLFLIMMTTAVGACATGQEVRYSPAAVYHLVDGRQQEINSSTAKPQLIAPYLPRLDLVVPGRRAAYRIAEPHPILLATVPADDVIVVRLRPGDQQNDRNLGIKIQSGADVSIRDEDIIEVVRDAESAGFVRLRPQRPLQPGEYAIVSRTNIRKTPGRVRMFEFGVD